MPGVWIFSYYLSIIDFCLNSTVIREHACMISILLHCLRFPIWTRIASILVYVPGALENNIHFNDIAGIFQKCLLDPVDRCYCWVLYLCWCCFISCWGKGVKSPTLVVDLFLLLLVLPVLPDIILYYIILYYTILYYIYSSFFLFGTDILRIAMYFLWLCNILLCWSYFSLIWNELYLIIM